MSSVYRWSSSPSLVLVLQTSQVGSRYYPALQWTELSSQSWAAILFATRHGRVQLQSRVINDDYWGYHTIRFITFATAVWRRPWATRPILNHSHNPHRFGCL